MKPYVLLADVHAHQWSQFSTVGTSGVNSRLKTIIMELFRACTILRANGGDTVVIAGDLFHTRGSIDPEVFNPVHQAIKSELEKGIKFIAIPGNHDLKGKDTTELGNAFTSLAAPGFRVISQPTYVPDIAAFMVPWFNNLDDLRKVMADPHACATADLIIHAGIDGVINMPAGHLSPAELAKLGYRRVFAGHYHNHKVMESGKVISIGATTHQTFSDIGTKAGFLSVTPSDFIYHASHAPSFVEINDTTPEDEIEITANGNFVRVRGFKFSDAEIAEFRKELLRAGAKGVSIEVARNIVSARPASAASKAVSIENSIELFIDSLGVPKAALIKAECSDILTSVRVVA